MTLPTHFLQIFLQIWGAPLASTTIEAKGVKVHLGEEMKDPVEDVVAEEQS